MEFTLQSDNVQVTLKEDKQRYDGYNSRVEEDAKDENKIIHNNTKSNIIPQKEILDSSGNKLIRFEILLKLEDYYLINNIRLKGEIEDISIKKIKFQNVNTGLWESVSFFNPDNKETFVKEKDSISIFSVGLTQYIKLELVIKCNSELFVNKTSDRETSPLRIMKNMNGDDINKLVVGSNHNSSMHEINRNAAFKLNNEKKKIFNLNVDYSSAKNNSNNHNLSNDKISSRSRSNTGCHNITEDNINILNHRALPKDPDYSTICNKLINDKIQKIIIYSQYLYTIPNSTFLLTLLNLKNFFKNNIKNEKIMIKNKISSSSNNENYLSSLFLTATSMIQARQFIQAWELVHNLQIYLIKNTDTNNSVFFKILLEPNNVQNGNHMLLSLSSEQNEAPSRTPIFLTKLEIIKTVCIYEYGHILAFLDSLRNLVNIYFLNDYSHISYNFSWAKNNEIASDRNFIQNFLIENGKNLGEILITMINDQTEIVTVSALKIIEFILDHNPTVLIPYYSKILKYLLAFLYPRGSTENSKCLSLKNLPNINSDNQVAYCNYLKDFDDKKIFFPLDFFFTFVNQFDKTNKENEIAENERVKKEKQKDSTSSSFNNMSTFLLKQVNYTLDTLIDTLETLPQIEIIGIITKINNILFNILKNNESENVTAINITKIIKKLYDNLNTSILEIFFKSKKNGYIHNISGSNPYIIPEYIFILLVSNLNSNTKLFNKFRDFTNPQQVKNYNKNFTFFKPEMTLLDNSEIGGLISFMFEKISDECFLFSEREFSINLINWLSSNLEIITNHLNSNVPVPGDNNKTYLEEFSIFYAYHLLFLLNNLFFSKSEIKHGLSRIFITKMHPESINYLSKLITILIKFEEVCLGIKKCLILFEPTIEILKKIRGNYSSLFNVDYSSFFVDQYEKLYSFMSKTGIFNENIFYMIKTIEFININSDNLSSGDYRAQTVLQNIFTLVLQNFSIYYSDDMVELFNSLIYILRDNMNEKMISDIIIAIINKYNYKGQNFTLCCSKFFQVIIKSETSFQFMKNVLLKGIDKYNENLVKNAGDIFKFKESHLEFLEKFEIYMKYLEFLKSESYLEMCLKNSNYEDFNLRHDNLLFSDVESFNCFLKLSKTSNETILSKIYEILVQDFLLLENSFEILLTKKLRANKETLTTPTTPNNRNRSHSNSLKDAALNSDPNHFSKIKSSVQNLFSVLEQHIKFLVEYYSIINKRGRNQNFIADSLRMMSKILIGFNNICEHFSTEALIFLDLDKVIKIPKLKINFFKSLYESTNFTILKELRLRTVFIELMNMFEHILIKGKEISTETNIKDYYSYIIPMIVQFLDNSDDYQKIFGIEIIFKIFSIKFEDDSGFKINSEYKNCLTLPTFIWEKIINLTNHFNYKVGLFAMYIVQVVAPRDVIENLTNSKLNKLNLNTKDSSSFSNLRFSIEPLDIDTKNFPDFFMNDEEIEFLHIFIRDKIIYESKSKNIEKGNECVETAIEEIEEKSEAILNKIDEVNDVDIGKIPEFNEDKGKGQEIIKDSQKNKPKLEITNNQKMSPHNPSNKVKYKCSPRDLDKEEILSLEDLGVVEVEDEIFDNFDDDNIPVLKNTYSRKKGSSEKLKTNQTTNNLLMSDHVKKDQTTQNNKNKEKERYIEKKENFNNEKKDIDMAYTIPQAPKTLKINVLENNPPNNYLPNTATKRVFDVMNSINAQNNPYSNSNQNQSNKNILVVDENSIVEKQIKKKNVRPQNGLRPATPPLKEENSNRKASAEKQIVSKTNILDNHDFFPSDIVEDQLLTSPFSSINKYEDINLPLAMDSKKNKSDLSRDKKYEIKSMEELFLEDEELKETRPIDVINKDYDDFIVEPDNLKMKEQLGGYDEEILSSFENLNLEDFKNLGNPVEDEIILDDNFNFVNSMNKFNQLANKTDHPILDQINEYLIKGNSYYRTNNQIEFNNNLDDVLTNPYFSDRNDEIKIEDYDQEVAALDILENEYNSNPLNEELENTNKNNRYEEDKSIHADDKILKVNNFYFGELDNSNDVEGNDVVGDVHSLHSNETLPIAEDFCKNNSKYESYKEIKSKRPPTRYGNREDQIKWDEMEGREIIPNKHMYTTRMQQIEQPLISENLLGKKENYKPNNTNDNIHNNSIKAINDSNSKNSTSNTARNIGNVLKNKTKFQSILGMNKTNQIGNPGLNFNNLNINNTLISKNSSNKERINSPETNGYSSNTYIGSNSNTVLKNETQDEIRKNYNSNSLLTANSSKNSSNKKNIHTLHNLHNKNTLNIKINKPEAEKKISSEFRKILKLKLTKNSDKIFANLKKLSNLNETSRINNESRRETLKNESPFEKPQEMNRIMSNPDLLKRDRDIKIMDCELEEYNSPNNIINMNNLNSTQNSKQPSKKPNYNIMTNLTEIASINKTPNFNYNIAHELKNK